MEVPAIQIQTDKGLAMKYADSIDLSNACRAFYQARLESTRRMKEKWRDLGETGSCGDTEDGCCNGKNSSFRRRSSGSCGSSRRGSDSDGCGGGGIGGSGGVSTGSRRVRTDGRKMTSLDVAIDLLRREMATLMDQDLCLMKQLLTLNEEIEDLKWRRRYGWSRTSSFCSSDNMIQSAASLGRVDEHPKLEFLTPSSLSLQLDDCTTRLSIYNDDDPVGTFNRSGNVATSATYANVKADTQDPINGIGHCPTQTKGNDEGEKSIWCRVNGHCSETKYQMSHSEVSAESNMEGSTLDQTSRSSSEKRVSSRVEHAVENDQICTGERTGCSANSHKADSSSSSAIDATYENVCYVEDSCRTSDKLNSNKGSMPKSSPCRNKWSKKLVDADVESQDSGIHDCFGST